MRLGSHQGFRGVSTNWASFLQSGGMYGILAADDATVPLPPYFTDASMHRFIAKAIDEQCDAHHQEITFDFSGLKFIEPVGVVVLSNLIEYFLKIGVETKFDGLAFPSSAVIFLDDAGFFAHYLGEPLRPHAKLRETTMPLRLVANAQAIGYLYADIVPWLAGRLSVQKEALATVRVCLQEIFHNISDHSGVNIGCVFAQHFPADNKVNIAISDFGLGIPANVRQVAPALTDAEALRLAVQEGFTTKSNVQNRGAGLPILIRYVTAKNGGVVLLNSGRGYVSAVAGKSEPKITARLEQAPYPGTLVRVILNTNSLRDFAIDAEAEEFSW
jgi:anti-sigma regulatory factor (Ser/Thr protein kinase)